MSNNTNKSIEQWPRDTPVLDARREGRATYPAARDPTMYVKRSTDDFAYTLGDINLGSHLPQYNTRTRGYVQFNSLPALLSNAPI